MKISVVIPVYNEIDTIEEILSRVDKVSIKKEIIVIDDLSTDGTRERLKEIVADKENVKVIYHSRNKGKGAALRTGVGSSFSGKNLRTKFDMNLIEITMRARKAKTTSMPTAMIISPSSIIDHLLDRLGFLIYRKIRLCLRGTKKKRGVVL